MADAQSRGPGPVYFRPAEVPWADDRASGRVPPSMLDAADELGGGGRKMLAAGEGGFHSTYSEVPPGYVMPPHRHDRDELFVVLGGSCTWSDGQSLAAPESVVLPAGCTHGYAVGPDGLRVLTVTTGPFETVLVGEGAAGDAGAGPAAGTGAAGTGAA